MDATVDITVNCEAWRQNLPDIEGHVRAVVQTAFLRRVVAIPSDRHWRSPEISILLSDDTGVQALNKRYRRIDRPTNVLAFPTDDPEFLDAETRVDTLGDIVLAFETVTIEAASQGKTFGDHMTHLVIHGLLHLLGHDHALDKDAHVMEALEIEILADLGISDPYEGANPGAGRND